MEYQWEKRKTKPRIDLVHSENVADLFPDEGTTSEDLMVMLWQPPDDHPVDELWPPVGGFTQGSWQTPVVGDPYIEIAVTAL